MKRRIITFLLALVLVFSPVRVTAEGEQTYLTEDLISYKIAEDSDGEYVVITDYAGSAIAGKGTELVIPDMIDGRPVKRIDHDAFCSCIELASVTIPETVTSIGYRAFENCSYLERVTLPESITSIGHSVFQDCVRLKDVNIPGGLTTLELEMFAGCTSLTNVTIPEGVTYIDVNVFSGCTGLTADGLKVGDDILFASQQRRQF